MKKIITIAIVIFTSVVLSGCQLIPDEIEDKVTQELCAENPDHELCDLDNVEELEQELIVDLVEKGLTKINGDGCPDVLFSGNVELTETCKTNPEELVPEGVTSIELVSFEQMDDTYVLLVNTNVDGLQLEIKISVVEIDGKSYIDSWTTTKTMLELDEISPQEAQAFVEKFFMSFGDSSIANEDFCPMYFDGEDNDCDGLRDSFFMYNREITEVTLTEDKKYEFRGHVTVLKAQGGGGGTANVDVELVLFRQDFGPVQVQRLTPDTEITTQEADSFFDIFFEALTDPDLSNDDFCAMYYDGVDQDCDGVRDDFNERNTEVLSIQLSNDKRYEFRGHVTVLKAMGGGNSDEDIELTLSLAPFGPIFVSQFTAQKSVDIMEMAEEKLTLLFEDFYDPMISDEAFYSLWVPDKSLNRSMQNDDEYESLQVVFFEELDDDSVDAYVRVKFKAGSDLSKKVNIAYDGDTDEYGDVVFIYRFFDPEAPDSDLDMALIEQYIEDYFDPDLDNDGFFDIYFGAGETNLFTEDRNEQKDGTVQVSIKSSGFGYSVSVSGSTTRNVIAWTLEVRVNRWESKAMLDINNPDNDCDGVCEYIVTDREEHILLFNLFIDDYFDKTVSDETFNMRYFDNMMDQEFFDVRKEVQEMKQRYSINYVVGLGADGTLTYILDVGDPESSNGEPTKVTITKRIDKSSPLLFHLDPDDDGDSIPTDEEINVRLSDFGEMANHVSIAYTEMCRVFTPDYRVESCAMMLSSKIATGYQLTNLFRLKQRPDLLVQEWDNAVGETVTEVYRFYPYYNEVGEVVFELIPYTPNDEELVYIAFTPYVESLNRVIDNAENTCNNVSESSQDECMEIKTFLLQTRYITELEYLYYDNDLMKHVVAFNVYSVDGELIGKAEYDVLISAGNPLHQDRGNRAVNPMFEQSDN